MKTESIPIQTYPLEATYKSFEGAVSGALEHPLQERARSDSTMLKGAHLTDAVWTLREYGLQFDNGHWLHVFPKEQRVRWRISVRPPALSGGSLQHIGTEAVMFDWGPPTGVHMMDASDMFRRRLGAEFTMLFINEGGVLLYMRKHWIVYFHCVCRKDSGEDVLYLDEDE